MGGQRWRGRSCKGVCTMNNESHDSPTTGQIGDEKNGDPV
jgi:hypothetical protein